MIIRHMTDDQYRILNLQQELYREQDTISKLNKIIEELKIALHDSVNKPKGIVPDSAQKYYQPQRYYEDAS